MDLDEIPTHKPPPRRRLKGFGFAVLMIVIIALVIFVGYNTFYATHAR